MIDFDFISPTKIYFGTNKEELVGQICSERGYKRVYIVIGQGSVKRSGLLDIVLKSLDENDIQLIYAVKVLKKQECSLLT